MKWIDQIPSMRAMQAMNCSVESLWYNGIASLTDDPSSSSKDLFSDFANRCLLLSFSVAFLLCDYSLTPARGKVNSFFTKNQKKFYSDQIERVKIIRPAFLWEISLRAASPEQRRVACSNRGARL